MYIHRIALTIDRLFDLCTLTSSLDIFCSHPRQAALPDLAYSILKSFNPSAIALFRFFPFFGGKTAVLAHAANYNT